MKKAIGIIITAVIAAAAALAVRTCILTVYAVPDNTLEPELHRGQRVLLCRLAKEHPQKGDIVIVDMGSSDFIGRIVMTPGDTLTSNDGKRRYVIPDIRRCPHCGCDHPRNYLVKIGRHHTLVHETHVMGKCIYRR